MGWLALAAALVAGLRAWQQRDLVEGVVPAFEARELDGGWVSSAEFAGRPWLLYFWGSWCAVCELQAGVVSALAREWPVLTVAMESGDGPAVAAYLREAGLDWRTVPDPDGALARRFGVRAVPTWFVVDGAGRVRFREVGYTTALGLRLRLQLSRWLEAG